jgi:hypothetical protein
VAIWCDLNGDLDFEDADELLFAGTSLDTSFSGNITIPETATAGSRRLRIRNVNNNLLGAGNSCTFYNTGGEIEDYTITVDQTTGSGPLVVRYPNATGITLNTTGTATATARWSKGATTFGRVRIKMSDNGGATYPYLLVDNTSNLATDTSENFTIPGIITNQARIRITNQNDSTVGDFSDNDFIFYKL